MGGAVGDLRDLAGQRKALPRTIAFRRVVIPTVAPFGVLDDCESFNCTPSDLHRTGGRNRRDRHQRPHEVGVHRAPFEHLHTAHRSADDRQPGVDPQFGHEEPLGTDDVAHRDLREGWAVGLGGVGVDTGRSSGSLTAAQYVGADDEVAIGVEGLPRADQVVPPTVALVPWLETTGGVRIAGECVAYQNRIGMVGRQRAPGLVCDLDFVEVPATLEDEWTIV